MQKAEDLYRKIGFRAITMDELSSQLGISKKTIYQFFEDKDALVDAIMENQISITQQDCAISHEMATNAIDEIFITMEMITQDFQDLNPIVIHDLHKFHPKTFEKFLRHKNEFIYQIIRMNIERGISEGLYRADLDIDILTRLRLETMMLAFNQDVFPKDTYNLIHITSVLMEHFLHGIVTEEGYRLIKEYKKIHNTK